MKLEEMSVVSDIGRKMSGRLSGKEHVRRIALTTLEQIANWSDPKELRRMFEGEISEEALEFLHRRIRLEAIEAIKAIKTVEK